MKFNTNHLGYKLLTGRLTQSRKHSEQLNKFLAGFFDSDGYVGLAFHKKGDRFLLQPRAKICQSASNDPDFEMMRALQSFYKLGFLFYEDAKEDAHSSAVVWMLGITDMKKLYNVIGKHLMVKATHYQDMIWLHESLRGVKLTASQAEELKEFSQCSRSNSRWLKHPKHISTRYLAGLIVGDGWITCRIRRKQFMKKTNTERFVNELGISIKLHPMDLHILLQIQRDYGGTLTQHKSGNMVWFRSLGRNSGPGVVKFLRSLSESLCLLKKYTLVQEIIKFHKQPAETKQCKLGRVSDSPISF